MLPSYGLHQGAASTFENRAQPLHRSEKNHQLPCELNEEVTKKLNISPPSLSPVIPGDIILLGLDHFIMEIIMDGECREKKKYPSWREKNHLRSKS